MKANTPSLALIAVAFSVTVAAILKGIFDFPSEYWLFTSSVFLLGLVLTLLLDFFLFKEQAFFPSILKNYTSKWKGYVWLIHILIIYFLLMMVYLIGREGLFSKASGTDLLKSLIAGASLYLWILAIYTFFRGS